MKTNGVCVQFCFLWASFFWNGQTGFVIGQLCEVIFPIIQVAPALGRLQLSSRAPTKQWNTPNVCCHKTYGMVCLHCHFIPSWQYQRKKQKSLRLQVTLVWGILCLWKAECSAFVTCSPDRGHNWHKSMLLHFYGKKVHKVCTVQFNIWVKLTSVSSKMMKLWSVLVLGQSSGGHIDCSIFICLKLIAALAT